MTTIHPHDSRTLRQIIRDDVRAIGSLEPAALVLAQALHRVATGRGTDGDRKLYSRAIEARRRRRTPIAPEHRQSGIPR
jgi:hypothetical protein